MSQQQAQTAVPIHAPIAKRWSPRAFGSAPVSREDLTALLEAARWAPSCFGAEPWRFVLGVLGEGPGHAAIASALMPANRIWAEKAPVLMVTLARAGFEHNEKPNAWAKHDVGLAMGQLGVEASARGLVLHQMGGFDPGTAREALSIPAGFEPVAAVALGHPGEASDLPEELAEREAAERSRKALAEIAFEGRFGEPFAAATAART